MRVPRAGAGAVEAFTRRHLDPIDRYLGTLARSPDRVDEVRQRLAVRLLVGDEGRAPSLEEYGGQGSLEGWIRVSAVRTALMLERGERATAPVEDRGAKLPDAYDGELVYLRQRYRVHFKRALEVALKVLDPTHRVMLRLHFVEGMTTAAMATVYQMSRATLVRRLSDAKTALREGVASEIARTLTLTPEDYAELLGSVKSVLDVSIARLLQEPESP